MKKQLLLILFFNSYLMHTFASSEFTIKNSDNFGVGFNDTSKFQAQGIGGNYATTLGQARLNAIQFAANQLSKQFNSTVAIDIIARFVALGGSANSAKLAQAGSPIYDFNFTGAREKTLYPSALAEKITGRNRNLTQPGDTKYDIVIEINSDIDGSVVFGNNSFYYGFDAKPPAGDIDFVTVIKHELIHGLGFSVGPMILSTGAKIDITNNNTGTVLKGFSTVYTLSLEHHNQATSNYDLMTNDQRFAANTAAVYNGDTIIASNLHWIGESLNSAATSNPGFQVDGSIKHAGMFAPRQIKSGSSVSHFSLLFEPNEMMEPAYTGPNHDIGFAAQVMQDIGWGPINSNSASTDLNVTLLDTTSGTGLAKTYLLTVMNAGSNNATGTVLTVFLPAGSSNSTVIPDNRIINTQCNNKFIATNRIVSCFIPDNDLIITGSSLFTITTTLVDNNNNVVSAVVDSLNPENNTSNNWISEPKVLVTPQNKNSPSSQSSGGCVLTKKSKFDPVLSLLFLFFLLVLYRTRKLNFKCCNIEDK